MSLSLLVPYITVPLLITTTILGCQVIGKKNNEQKLESLRLENSEIESTIEKKENEIARQITNMLLTSQSPPEENVRAAQDNNNEIEVPKSNNSNIYYTFVCFLFLFVQMGAYYYVSEPKKNDNVGMYKVLLLVFSLLNLFLIAIFQFYFLQTEDWFNYITLFLNLFLSMKVGSDLLSS